MKLIISCLGILLVNFPSALSSLTEVRKFTTVINPDCQDAYPRTCNLNKTMTLLHIKSDGKEDSYHFLWSFIGAPTLIMARTSLNSKLSINWAEMFQETQNASISFEPQPIYSFGWSLVKIFVANDTEDVVNLDKINQTDIAFYRTKNFIWERLDNESYANSTHIHYSLISRNYIHEQQGNLSLGPQGYFKFTIRMKSSEGYSDILPYMLYSDNITQVDIAFNDVQLNTTEADYPKNLRIGFNYLIVQDEIYTNNSERMRLLKTKTLDDGHTPGVFETYSVRTPILNHTDESFIQWKPICYTGEVRDVINSVEVISYPLLKASSVNGDDNVHDTILYSFYGDNIEILLLESMNISFGTTQDGFYQKTKHISWTYSTGFGEPPEDFVSLLVILIVGIGLGIPALIIILSVVYVVVKRLKRPRDDLLLGR